MPEVKERMKFGEALRAAVGERRKQKITKSEQADAELAWVDSLKASQLERLEDAAIRFHPKFRRNTNKAGFDWSVLIPILVQLLPLLMKLFVKE